MKRAGPLYVAFYDDSQEYLTRQQRNLYPEYQARICRRAIVVQERVGTFCHCHVLLPAALRALGSRSRDVLNRSRYRVEPKGHDA